MSEISLSPTRRELLAATAAAGAISLLPGTLRAAAGGDAIRPFTVSFPQEEIAELRRRVAATRWPDRETVKDDTQGVQFDTMQKLANYWATDYDWSKMRGAAERPAALHHRDRRARHPLHPCPLEA